MDINSFISEQEKRLDSAASTSVQAAQDPDPDPFVLDPVPIDPPHLASRPPIADPELVSEMLDMLRSAHTEVIDAFIAKFAGLDGSTTLPQHKWQRSAVQSFMVSEQVQKVEKAIEEQCLIVMRESNADRRQEAFGRVEEGVVYWRRLIMWQINKGNGNGNGGK